MSRAKRPRGDSSATESGGPPLKFKHAKHYIKFLSSCHDPITSQFLLRKAPDPVVKSICNAALNALKGKIKLSKRTKQVLKRYKSPIVKLVDPKPSIRSKRRALVQKGGAFFLPLLLATIISQIGSQLLLPRK